MSWAEMRSRRGGPFFAQGEQRCGEDGGRGGRGQAAAADLVRWLRMPPDYYAELEISAAAPADEVRAAYRRLAKANHPDTNESPEAIARMRRINEAWETLRDAGKRAEYDRSRPRVAARPLRRQPPPRRTAAAPATPQGRPQQAWPIDEDAPRTGARTFDGDASVDWYAYLGVPADAPRAAVQQALARAVAKLDAEGVSATQFAKGREDLRRAWSILGDPHVRAAYDRARKAAASGAPPPPAGVDDGPPAMPAGYRGGPVAIGGLMVGPGALLAGVDLRGADLRGLDLAGADLRDARLQGACLEAASLRRAALRGVDLSGADLRWADLAHADLSGATLRQATLARAALHATRFVRADLTGADLSGALAPAVNLDFAVLTRTDFSGAKVTPQLIERGRLDGTIFPDGSVRGG